MKESEAIGVLIGLVGIFFLNMISKNSEILSPNGTDCTTFIMIVVFVTIFVSGLLLGKEMGKDKNGKRY